MVADKLFGLTLLYVLWATEAQVSYFTRLGGQPAGNNNFVFRVLLWIDLWREPFNEGLSLNTSYLVQYLRTVNLRLKTRFTIDS